MIGDTAWRPRAIFIISVFAVATAIVAALGFWNTLHRNPLDTRRMRKLNPGAEKVTLPDEDNFSGTPYPLGVDIVVEQLDAVSNVQVNLKLHRENEEEYRKIQGPEGDVPGSSDQDAELRLEPPFSERIALKVPLSQLKDFNSSVSLPLHSGVPSQYPEDWYEASTWVSIELPDNWEYAGGSGGGGPGPTIPVKLALQAERNTGILSYYSLDQKEPVSVAEMRLAPIQRLRLRVQRDYVTRGFTWTMAATPFLLLVLTGITPLSRSSDSNPVSLEAVALLAILPLRQVLVPSEIRGLTPVDFLLGTELAIFIALIAVRYGISLERVRAV
jgi:hypothetical protein